MEWSWGSGGAKVLGTVSGPGVLLIWTIVGKGLIAFGCLDIFALVYICSILSLSLSLSLSLRDGRYRLKYCL